MLSMSIISNSINVFVRIPSKAHVHLSHHYATMKKRQFGILWLLVWQAISILTREKKLRYDIKATPSLIGKLTLFCEQWLSTNKKIIEDIKKTDRKETSENLQESVKNDRENAQDRFENQKKKDWEQEGRTLINNLIEKTPTRDDAETFINWFKDKVVSRWDNLAKTDKEAAEDSAIPGEEQHQ